MRPKSRLIRYAAIAALAGSTAGGVAGLWSLRDRTSSVAAAAKPAGRAVAAPVAAPPAAPPSDATRVAAGPEPTAHDGQAPSTGVATNGVAPPGRGAASVRPRSRDADGQSVVERARALAARPDVSALVALRDDISRRAEERGEQESPATQQLLHEVDRYLAEARLRRLKLDGEALRKGEK